MKKFTKIYVLPLFIGILCLLANSCKEENNSAEITVTDKAFYEQIGYTIIKCYTDTYNQNLAGKPTGTQNITTTGPMGGTVIITGSSTYDSTHSITTTDLTFTLTNVVANYSATSSTGNTTCTTQLTLTGVATYKGSFSSTYTSISHQSQNLHVVGSVTYAGVTRNIDQTGQVNINRASTVTANIFGNDVSW